MRGKMQATEIQEYGGIFHIVERTIPIPADGEVLIKVGASGLCSTDIHLLEGRMDLGNLPRIPGHEIAGTIEEIGAGVDHNLVGQRVTVALDVICGTCRYCRNGQPQRCQQKQRIGFERDGGHADYVVAPAINVVPLTDSINFEAACVLPDAVACMFHALISQGQLTVNTTVLIHGAGGLGIHGVQIAKLAGARVFATSRNDMRLNIAAEYGASPINTAKYDVTETILKQTNNEGVDIVADCIGSVQSIQESLAMVRAGGKVLVVGYIAEEFHLNSIDLMSNEKELIGSRGSSLSELQEVVSLVDKGLIVPVIGQRFKLSEINKAADSLRRGEIMGRIVLTRD